MRVKKWVLLFLDAGATKIVVEIFPMGLGAKAKNPKRLLSIREYLRIVGRIMILFIKDPETRGLLKYASSNLKQHFEYVGYGLFLGRKISDYNVGRIKNIT